MQFSIVNVMPCKNKIGSLDNKFILFGAGNLGRKVLNKLRQVGKEPAAFIDNNPAIWGKELNGVQILSPAESIKKFDPAKVGIITTIWCGEATDKMSDRIEPLIKLGYRNIALFGHLAWKFPEEFLPHYCLDRPSKPIDQADQIRTAFALLTDDESREIFVTTSNGGFFLTMICYPIRPKKKSISMINFS